MLGDLFFLFGMQERKLAAYEAGVKRAKEALASRYGMKNYIVLGIFIRPRYRTCILFLFY